MDDIHQRIGALVCRDRNTSKVDLGHALLVGGARGMTGAITISGKACLRTGAGLVTVGVPECCWQVVANGDPHYMTWLFAYDESGKLLKKASGLILNENARFNCLALGPGLGRSDATSEVVSELYQKWNGPMVVDADALFALSTIKNWINLPTCGPRLMTPHCIEWERLCGIRANDREQQEQAVTQFTRTAKERGQELIVVLKGPGTFVSDGHLTTRNTTGNPSMAVGGSGDCLTGIIAAMICQGLPVIEAARCGVYLHGLAGDLAHAELRSPSTLAMDLINYLPNAFRLLADPVP